MNKKDKKKPSKLQITAAIVIAVVFVFGLSSGDRSGSSGSDDSKAIKTDAISKEEVAKDEKTIYKVGDVIAFGNKEVAITSVERNWSSGNQFLMPEEAREFVKVQVTIENKSEKEVSYYTHDWKLQDSQGVIRDVSGSTYVADGGLESSRVAARGKVSGFVVFEAPIGDENLTLRYEPSFWSSKRIEVKL